MSFKTPIRKVEVTGADAYLGDDSFGCPIRSKDPDKVIQWLCDAYRFRFNEMRSRRMKYVTHAKPLLEPIGDYVDMRSNKEARWDFPWLRSVPELLLGGAEIRERNEWMTAAKRRKTLVSKGQPAPKMPRFLKGKDSKYFVLLYNKGRGYSVRKYSKKYAEVIIGCLNYPSTRYPDDGGAYFQIHIYFRPTVKLEEDMTGITVNWTDQTIVFTFPPRSRKHEPTGKKVGGDLGVVHEITLSDGNVLDLPVDKLDAIDKQIRDVQRAMCRCVNASKYRGDRNAYVAHGPSKRYLKLKERLGKLHARKTRITMDWQHKMSAWMVDEYDVIFLENINFQSMIRKPKPKPDPKHLGRFLPNHARAKAMLNFLLSRAAMGRFRWMIEYKASAANVTFLTVPAEFTSQTCHNCGYVSSENRESQAVFRCKRCGWKGNADLNAAINILNRGLGKLDKKSLPGGPRPRHGTRAQDQTSHGVVSTVVKTVVSGNRKQHQDSWQPSFFD